MQRDPKTPVTGPPVPRRPRQLSAAQLKAQKNSGHPKLWLCFFLGIFTLVTIFAFREAQKFIFQIFNAPQTEVRQAVTPTEAATPLASVPDNTPVPSTPAPVPPTVTSVPPTVAPPPPTVAPSPAVTPEVNKAPAAPEAVVSANDRLAAEAPLVLVGPDAQRQTTTERDAALLNRAIDGKAWDDYRGLLAKSIKVSLTKMPAGTGVNRFDPVWNETVLYQALLRWKTIGCFSESEISSRVTNSYTGAMFMWLLHDNHAMEELLLTIDPKDDGGQILHLLMEIWSTHQQDYQKYFPLALACAVVFDKPQSIAHAVGKSENEENTLINPMKRFDWFVEKNEKGKLAAPVHHSSARDLIWVVCAPIATSEMDWSIDKMQLRRKTWGQAYGMIRYLMERAVKGLNPYKEYSFAQILKEGGICGDQSYFCVNTARAQGVPAMTISGETNSGGHAWAAIKTESNEWTTTVGRIAGASNGQAKNPQTGTAISEQEIQLWNDRLHQSPIVTISVWRHLWLADFFAAADNLADNAASIRLANSIGHSFVETWQALYALLARQTKLTGEPPSPNNLEEWKNFVSAMRREYKDNPRMATIAATAEAEYIFPYGTAGDVKRTFVRERRRVERDAGEQKDLIATSLKRQAEAITKAAGPDAKRDIGRLYDRALRQYGGSVTGFKMMANDYFSYCKDDNEAARKAARDIELAFKRVGETGSTDWFRATTEAEIYKMICEFYRSAGEPERATQLEKRYEIQMRRAKRGAL